MYGPLVAEITKEGPCIKSETTGLIKLNRWMNERSKSISGPVRGSCFIIIQGVTFRVQSCALSYIQSEGAIAVRPVELHSGDQGMGLRISHKKQTELCP